MYMVAREKRKKKQAEGTKGGDFNGTRGLVIPWKLAVGTFVCECESERECTYHLIVSVLTREV